MTKTKKIFTSVIALAMVLCTLFTMIFPASAATCSSGTQTRTITVETKGNWWVPGSESITIKQTKGTCVKENYNIFTGKTTRKSSSQYGQWNISVKATDGSHSYTKTLKDGSIKLSLKPNKTYKITISWDAQAAIFKTMEKGNYTSYPTWRVSGTYKVSNYY